MSRSRSRSTVGAGEAGGGAGAKGDRKGDLGKRKWKAFMLPSPVGSCL